VPKSLQSKDKSGGTTEYYLIYRFIAFIMDALHQPLSEILSMDINEAGMLIKQYNYLHRDTSKKSKKPANSLPKIDYDANKKSQD